MPIDCAKNVDKNWNITVSLIICVNFDHEWVEHYLGDKEESFWVCL